MSAIVIDTETTGFKDPEPIEIAWIRLEFTPKLKVTGSFNQRFKPSKAIELGALATHHILDEDLVDCESHTSFTFPEATEYLIGHNVDFDWSVLGKPSIKLIDTLSLARKLWPTADTHSLGAMTYLLRRSEARVLLKETHSALADVKNCVRLLSSILAKLGSPTKWEDVWRYSEDARVPELMPFGKHKSMSIKDVPADYKRWLLGQPDVDPYLVKALRG
ncbi:MAG: 3'-5' exonuclease [Gemmatimonadaceae bacterium]